ncbi:hypothetical protein [Lysinibacillus odysseyi]|uniref:Uncharacterized protein n=1 Tax=Lysinibacillus odysseyi 34hs-1 = NBRC 100172 TaxID=1220589 RepID=A0A0A3IRH9_9BACI|nr:hypothetical protein [Lysinibacillus odysseyi]KGR86085.1 hypothetical protein CD32_06710 [Lysinibacillus odysseyi 34hs-1 = NBRC 100172]
MAKLKGKGVVLAGLVAGAASYLSKKENRDKAMEYFNQLKGKANQFQQETGGVQGLVSKITNPNDATHTQNVPNKSVEETMASTQSNKKVSPSEMAATGNDGHVDESLSDIAETAAEPVDLVLEGNHMVDEGAQTTVHHYNEEQDPQDSKNKKNH